MLEEGGNPDPHRPSRCVPTLSGGRGRSESLVAEDHTRELTRGNLAKRLGKKIPLLDGKQKYKQIEPPEDRGENEWTYECWI